MCRPAGPGTLVAASYGDRVSTGPVVLPVTPGVLADLALESAARSLPRARNAGVVLRLGVDGAVHEQTGALADLVAARALDTGVAVLRVRGADFLHRRSVRLEWGSEDVDAAYERWVDAASLRREVLDPLGDPARLTWLPRLWDAAADRPVRSTVRRASAGALAVVDGPYLLRPDLATAFDLVVHLTTSPAALGRQFATPDPRPAAWQRYLNECDPATTADITVRYDHPERPAVVS